MAIDPQNMDKHYSHFFKKELPHPWPDAPMPMIERVTPLASSVSNSRSRLTLLACLSLVAAGAVGIVQFPQSSPDKNVASESMNNPLTGATADGKGILTAPLKKPTQEK